MLTENQYISSLQIVVEISGLQSFQPFPRPNSPAPALSLSLSPAKEILLDSGEGKRGNFGSFNPDEMPRIPMIKFPKRNLKAPSPSPSTPGIHSLIVSPQSLSLLLLFCWSTLLYDLQSSSF
jgi:hypothetical protein